MVFNITIIVTYTPHTPLYTPIHPYTHRILCEHGDVALIARVEEDRSSVFVETTVYQVAKVKRIIVSEAEMVDLLSCNRRVLLLCNR